jgi:hypothetical protein
MDSKEELALLVHMPDKIVKFKQFSNGLYAMDPNDKTSFEMKKKPNQFLTTVKDNMKFLSKRQQERAKRARELLEVMGIPTVDDLKAMIRMNLIKNNVVTTEDVNLAMKAYGLVVLKERPRGKSLLQSKITPWRFQENCWKYSKT